MRHRRALFLSAPLALLLLTAPPGRRGRRGAGDPAARAPAAGLRARGVGEPQRRLGLPLRPGRTRARRERWFDDRARPASRSRSACRSPGDRSCPGSATRPTSRGTRARCACRRAGRGSGSSSWSGASDWRTSGWLDGEPIGSLPGGLHALRAGAHEGREARAGPEARPARGRHAAPVQARGQAGLRQGARAVADRLPRGAPGRPRGGARVPPGPGPEAGRGARAALLPRARRGRSWS